MAWYDQITDKFVANVANKYMQDNIWGPFNIFPKVNVSQKAGYVAEFAKEDWLRMDNPDQYVRTGATESVGDVQASGKQPFVLEQYAFHADISADERENYDNPFDPVSDNVEFVINRIRMIVAKKFANTVLTSGVWGTDYDIGTNSTKWNADGSDPIADVLAQAQAIESLTGFWPNKICMTRDVELALATNDAIKDVMAVTNTKIVTRQLLATIFKVDTVEVFSTVATTAKKGQSATASNTNYMASNQLLLCYAPDRATTKAPSAGIHPVYKGNGGNVLTRRIAMPEKNDALRIEGMIYTNPMILASDLGVRFYNIV